MTAVVNWGLSPELLRLGEYSVKYYSLCWLLAFGASYWVLYRVFRREKIDLRLLESLLIYIFVGTLVGARLGHCLFYDPEYYLTHPIEMLLPIQKIAGGWKFTGYTGLASHGAAIGIIASIVLYAWRYKVNVWRVMDKLGLVAPLGGAFIRLGNLMNSEIIGMPTDVPWAFVFPKVDTLPRHPSQLYEAVCYFLIFAFIYVLYTKSRGRRGQGFFFALSITSIFAVRIAIEYTKEVQEGFEIAMRHTVGLDMGQLLSLPFVVVGVVLMVVFWRPKGAVGATPNRGAHIKTTY